MLVLFSIVSIPRCTESRNRILDIDKEDEINVWY